MKAVDGTNLVASRHIKREQTSLPVNVRCSKTPLLKITRPEEHIHGSRVPLL